jgi:hypothetical protein
MTGKPEDYKVYDQREDLHAAKYGGKRFPHFSNEGEKMNNRPDWPIEPPRATQAEEKVALAAMDREHQRKRNNASTHRCYETGMKGVPDCIKDTNGDVVLGLCMNCGRGEIELEMEPCDFSQAKVPVHLTKAEVHLLSKLVANAATMLLNTFKDSKTPFDLGPLAPLREKMLNVECAFSELARTGKPYDWS